MLGHKGIPLSRLNYAKGTFSMVTENSMLQTRCLKSDESLTEIQYVMAAQYKTKILHMTS